VNNVVAAAPQTARLWSLDDAAWAFLDATSRRIHATQEARAASPCRTITVLSTLLGPRPGR